MQTNLIKPNIPFSSTIFFITILITIANQQQVPQQTVKCIYGQFLSKDNICMQCLTTCSRCKDYVSKCAGCSQNQKLDANSNKCQSCGIGQLNCGTQGNKSCQLFYNKVNGKCIPECQVQNCQRCTSIFNKTCHTCRQGYTLSENKSSCTLKTSTAPPRRLESVQNQPTLTSPNQILKNFNMAIDQNIPVNVSNILPTSINNKDGFNQIIDKISSSRNVTNNTNPVATTNPPQTTTNKSPTPTPPTTTSTDTSPNNNPFAGFPNFDSTAFSSSSIPPFSSFEIPTISNDFSSSGSSNNNMHTTTNTNSTRVPSMNNTNSQNSTDSTLNNTSTKPVSINTTQILPANGSTVNQTKTNSKCKIGTYLNTTTKVCQACNIKCATCVNTADQCLQCAQGWKKYGWKCVRNQTVGFRLSLQIPTMLKQTNTNNNIRSTNVTKNNSNTNTTNTTNTTKTNTISNTINNSQISLQEQLETNIQNIKKQFITNLLPAQYANHSLSTLTLTNVTFDQSLRSLILQGAIDKLKVQSNTNIQEYLAQKLKDRSKIGTLLLKNYSLGIISPNGVYVDNSTTTVSNPTAPQQNPENKKMNLLAILIPSIIGGLIILALISFAICYCNKCCFFKQQKPSNDFNQIVPVSSQRNQIKQYQNKQQIVTYNQAYNPHIETYKRSGNIQSGFSNQISNTGRFESLPNNNYDKNMNNQHEVGSDEIIDSQQDKKSNKDDNVQVVDYANDNYRPAGKYGKGIF